MKRKKTIKHRIEQKTAGRKKWRQRNKRSIEAAKTHALNETDKKAEVTKDEKEQAMIEKAFFGPPKDEDNKEN